MSNGSRWRRWVLGGGAIVLVLLFASVCFGNTLARRVESDAPGRSHGTPADGLRDNGKRLPDAGPNFVAYSRVGTALGRNAVHGQVRDAVLDAYAALALDAAARRHDLRIDRVIYEQVLQPALFAAPGGPALRKRVPFMAHGAWVRHDEHYHVDFRLARGP